MNNDSVITALLFLGVILLLFGILKDERVKARMFYRMPGGKSILSALGIFTVILALVIIK